MGLNPWIKSCIRCVYYVLHWISMLYLRVEKFIWLTCKHNTVTLHDTHVLDSIARIRKHDRHGSDTKLFATVIMKISTTVFMSVSSIWFLSVRATGFLSVSTTGFLGVLIFYEDSMICYKRSMICWWPVKVG